MGVGDAARQTPKAARSPPIVWAQCFDLRSISERVSIWPNSILLILKIL